MNNVIFRFCKSNLKVKKEGSAGSISNAGDYILGGLISGRYSINQVIPHGAIYVYTNYDKFAFLYRKEKYEDEHLDMLVSKITSALKNGEYMNIVINRDSKSEYAVEGEHF